jgi:hypothetical protein
VAIVVPPDAYLDPSGREWRCNRGYERADEACAKIDVPPNAFLRSNGKTWDCGRGYRKTDRACVGIAVPENAYLAASGDRWQCERGFRVRGATCGSLDPRADTSGLGDNWDCVAGTRSAMMHVAVDVPSHRFIDSSEEGGIAAGLLKVRLACLQFRCR